MPELTLMSAGTENPTSGTDNNVSVQMGSTRFEWTFDTPVQWGYFIDGQPWIVHPGGTLQLTGVTPARTNQSVYVPENNSTPVDAEVNMTVINPPIGSYYDWKDPLNLLDDEYYVAGKAHTENPGVFGWDGRNTMTHFMLAHTLMLSNTNLAWDGITPTNLFIGDSITSAKSFTGDNNPDRATILEAVAVLTVLSNAPPADAFRPGAVREDIEEDHYRTSPAILRYSDIKDLDAFLIPSPVGVTDDLKENPVTKIGEEYAFNYLRQLLPGPSFLNFGASTPSEGCSAFYNNSSRMLFSSGSSYGASMGQRMGKLAIGSLASWLSEEERKLCRIRFMQRAIDSFDAVRSGLVLYVDCGILPGYSTLITAAASMLNDSCPVKAEMLAVNQGVNGVPPWFVFAEYGMTYHTGVSTNELVDGEVFDDRGVPLDSDIPILNMTNVTTCIESVTSNTFTAPLTWEWLIDRPMQNLINLKMRITDGPGSGNTIYVITRAPKTSFYKKVGEDMIPYPGIGSTAYYQYGGTMTVKGAANGSGWQHGMPNSSSTLAFSVTTSEDDGRWLFTNRGQGFDGSLYDNKGKDNMNTAPDCGSYVATHLGGHLDQLIALYALDGEDAYKGGMDKWAIEAGTRPGLAEASFDAGRYMALLSRKLFRGALWRQEVLDKVGALFEYTDGTSDALEVPDPDALMWYE